MTDKQIQDPCDKCDVEPPAMKFKCPECEHNPDKEPVMIDGVDVSGCSYYNPLGNYNCGGTKKCSQWSNCYYKQLKRKEQECETLAGQLDFEVQKKECLEQECEELKKKCNIYTCGICGNKEDCNKLYKTLSEIKEIAKNRTNYPCDKCIKTEILQKISEVEND